MEWGKEKIGDGVFGGVGVWGRMHENGENGGRPKLSCGAA